MAHEYASITLSSPGPDREWRYTDSYGLMPPDALYAEFTEALNAMAKEGWRVIHAESRHNQRTREFLLEREAH